MEKDYRIISRKEIDVNCKQCYRKVYAEEGVYAFAETYICINCLKEIRDEINELYKQNKLD